MSKISNHRGYSEDLKEDILSQEVINDDMILANIKERFQAAQQPFTRVGSSVLVALHAHSLLSKHRNMAENYKYFHSSTDPQKAPLPAHLYDLAASAFQHMTKEGKDQCIILRYFLI